MLHQIINISREQEFIIACSGGVDSMAIADFYRRGGKKFVLAYFDHGTGNAAGALPVIREYANKHSLKLLLGKIVGEKPKDLSPEEYWRNKRYEWLKSICKYPVIVTAHHLQDACETWLFGSMHGMPKLISPQIEGANMRLIRPFLLNEKRELINWCINNNVKWFEDNSNNNVDVPRNRIRHSILPEVLKINPGFLKVIKKKYLSESFTYDYI